MANAPEEMLKNILSDPAAMEKISGMIESFGGMGGQGETSPAVGALPFGLDNPEVLLKIGKAWNQANNADDPRINLLSAVKPYLNEKRLRGAEYAIQMLRLGKMTEVFRELKIF